MYETAADISPSDHEPWGKLAAALRYVPDGEVRSEIAYQRAIETVEQQLSVNPDDPEDLALLGVYLANTGKLDSARDAIDQSLSLAPGNPSTHYFLAILELNAGNDEKTVESLAKAVQLGYSLKLLDADPEFAALKNRSAEFRALLDTN
jgi:serine/threonine-protein kinase